jgi:predicted alpha/beta-hydrolase family hydrolase
VADRYTGNNHEVTDRSNKMTLTQIGATAEAKSRLETHGWLMTGPAERRTHFILAHGAGAGMTSPFLTRIAQLLDEGGATVHRFEFGYMAARTAGGGRRPAPRAETLVDEYLAAIAVCRARIGPQARLFIGGKSMGGRIACIASTGAGGTGLSGVAVLGFPLIPPGKPHATRARVVEKLSLPTLIVQGTRDAFGAAEAFADVRIPAHVRLHWIADGDHDLKPRKASGRTHEEALQDAAEALLGFFYSVGDDVRRAGGELGQPVPERRR